MDPTHLEELKEYINTERNKYQIVVLSSFDYSEPINAYLTSNQIVDDLDSDNIRVLNCHNLLKKKIYHFMDLLNILLRPYIKLIAGLDFNFKGDECAFVPIYTTQDIEEVIFKIEHDTIFQFDI